MPNSNHARRPRRPTQADVGRLAGVSAATVSYVLNRASGQTISAATRERVLDAVAQLDYRPNQQARGLRTRQTGVIGFVTDEIAADPFAGSTILGAHEVAWSRGSLLMVVNTTRHSQMLRDVVNDLVARPVDAIIFGVVGTRRLHVPDALKGVPAILLNCWSSGDLYPSVLPDEVVGGRDATRMVLAAGHRKVAYLAGPSAEWASRARLRGFREALTEAGVDPATATVLEGDFRTGSGYELTRTLLKRPVRRRPTAILCGNDRMALGAYLALAEAGVRIPRDMSVVGYDDQTDLAADITPALSTMRTPYYQMGRWAAMQLVGGDAGQEPLPGRTYLPCPPVPRGSVGPPRVD
jgi:LacI family transcriptional regulator